MKFQIEDLRKLLLSVNINNIKAIQIKSKKTEIIINKQQLNYSYNNKALIYSCNENTITNNSTSNQQSTSTNESEIYSTIVSPMVGTFYRSPAPNEPAFIEKYEMVEKKQIVCIIEAMKLMNEIEAEVKGEIVEILVQDGDIVDCGQALMKVKTF
uniref:Biotin carboxyl carrier protein of acetyl-CoA carboxylase n=1 Tax=Pterocladia lucida TaxID=31408 RepID=A0A6M3WW35_PTELU|nr:accB [Pterocladia lucida]